MNEIAFPLPLHIANVEEIRKEKNNTTIPKSCNEISDINSLDKTHSGRYLLQTQYCQIPILLFGNKDADKLIVSFSSGSRIKEKNGQLFVRWKYNKLFNAIYVCIDSPMPQLFKDLQKDTPSWYLGNQKWDLCYELSKLILSLAQKFEIPIANVCLLGSSAGGYAACSIGAHINGCKVIAISPQLVISNWHEYPKFAKETQFNIKDTDRDNIIKKIIGSNKTKYFLTFNYNSKKDFNGQLMPLIKDLKYKYPLSYGIKPIANNIYLWSHCTRGVSLHSSGISKLEVAFLIEFAFQSDDRNKTLTDWLYFSKVLSEVMEEKAALEKKNIQVQTIKLAPVNVDLKQLYEQKRYTDILNIEQKMTPESIYFSGMAYYRLGEFSKAIKNFLLLEILDESKDYYDETLLGFAYFRDLQFKTAKKYFLKKANTDKNDLTNIAYFLGCSLLENEKVTSEFSDLFMSYSDKQQSTIFEKLVKFIDKYLLKINSKDLLMDIVKLQYHLDLRINNPKSDALYILIHPLISGKGLFGNKEFSCNCLFIEQRYLYMYFMLYTDYLLDSIRKQINQNYKEIIILSTSAGGYFSLLLGTYLSGEFSNSKIVVHSFSPQTLINNNPNLAKVTHYCHLQKYNSLNSVHRNLQKYGDLRNILRQSKNLEYNVYFGDSDAIDAKEANRITDLNLRNMNKISFVGFPYHQSLFIYRYSWDQLLKKLDTLKATEGGNDGNISIMKLKEIYNQYAPNEGLRKLLPHLL